MRESVFVRVKEILCTALRGRRRPMADDTTDTLLKHRTHAYANLIILPSAAKRIDRRWP